MDTRNKRASAIHVALPWRGMLPTPGISDIAINADDRAQLALMYRKQIGIITSTSILQEPVDYALAGDQKKYRIALPPHLMRRIFRE